MVTGTHSMCPPPTRAEAGELARLLAPITERQSQCENKHFLSSLSRRMRLFNTQWISLVLKDILTCIMDWTVSPQNALEEVRIPGPKTMTT